MSGIGSYDDRKGLGYGKLGVPNNPTRKLQQEFPYFNKDDSKDISLEDLPFEDDELDLFVKMINKGYDPIDYLNVSSQDPFYFVAGNTKLKESPGVTRGISPMPSLYKGRTASTGGTSIPANIHAPDLNRTTQPTGSKKGWSKSLDIDIVEPENIESIYDIPSDDERNLIDLKKLIAKIYYEQGTNRQILVVIVICDM